MQNNTNKKASRLGEFLSNLKKSISDLWARFTTWLKGLWGGAKMSNGNAKTQVLPNPEPISEPNPAPISTPVTSTLQATQHRTGTAVMDRIIEKEGKITLTKEELNSAARMLCNRANELLADLSDTKDEKMKDLNTSRTLRLDTTIQKYNYFLKTGNLYVSDVFKIKDTTEEEFYMDYTYIQDTKLSLEDERAKSPGGASLR